MPKKGGKKKEEKEFITHPLAVTYALAILLALSILALVAVTLNCTHGKIIIDSETGEAITQQELILTE